MHSGEDIELPPLNVEDLHYQKDEYGNYILAAVKLIVYLVNIASDRFLGPKIDLCGTGRLSTP